MLNKANLRQYRKPFQKLWDCSKEKIEAHGAISLSPKEKDGKITDLYIG
jgi:hypothetical protein